MTTRHPHPKDGDDAGLGAEAADQLHHRDDKREAADMRLEELVREVEYEEESHEEGSRVSPLVLGTVIGAVLVALALLAWLQSMVL